MLSEWAGGLHRLVLDGSEPSLAAVWPPEATTVRPSTSAVLRRAVADHAGRLAAEMSEVVQTNEVGRSAAPAGALVTVAGRPGGGDGDRGVPLHRLAIPARRRPPGPKPTVDLRTWPGDRRRILAHAGFHGAPVTWL